MTLTTLILGIVWLFASKYSVVLKNQICCSVIVPDVVTAGPINRHIGSNLSFCV